MLHRLGRAFFLPFLLINSNSSKPNRWLKQANQFAKNDIDRKNALKNAKAQITYWGPDNNLKTDLHEYAHKEWGGLLGTLYLNRWKLFMNYHLRQINDEETAKPDYYKLETDWAKKPDLFVPKKISNKKRNDLIKRILN